MRGPNYSRTIALGLAHIRNESTYICLNADPEKARQISEALRWIDKQEYFTINRKIKQGKDNETSACRFDGTMG